MRTPVPTCCGKSRRLRRPRLGRRAELAFFYISRLCREEPSGARLGRWGTCPYAGSGIPKWNDTRQYFAAFVYRSVPDSFHNYVVTFYRRNLPHLQRDAKPHFITFVTKRRWMLPEWAREIVLDCCRHDDGIRYKLHVAMVMPDHVHLILTPLVDPARQIVVSLAEIMKGIKGTSAHAINHRLGSGGTVWQEESFDRVLRSSESLDAEIEYVLNNPVRKALVRDWGQYRWVWQQAFVNPYAMRPT